MRVEVEDLVLDYRGPEGPERAIAGLSLRVERGESLAIVGHSGCGKTSLLYAIAGLIAPSSGSVLVDGLPLAGPRQGTALVLQEYGLFPWKTALDNVALGGLARGLPKRQAREAAHRVLEDLGIPDCAAKFPSELSGGQRQRVAIGRALALEPSLLLLDEPSSSLDAIAKESFQRLILEAFKKSGSAMLVVTHDIEEAAYLGGTIAVMEKGRIVAQMQNPLFGDEGLRERMDYYHLCVELRQRLRGTA